MGDTVSAPNFNITARVPQNWSSDTAALCSDRTSRKPEIFHSGPRSSLSSGNLPWNVSKKRLGGEIRLRHGLGKVRSNDTGSPGERRGRTWTAKAPPELPPRARAWSVQREHRSGMVVTSSPFRQRGTRCQSAISEATEGVWITPND